MRTSLLCLIPLAALYGCGGGSSDSAAASTVTVVVPALTPQFQFTTESDVVYGQGEIGTGGYKDLLLDLYVPAELTDTTARQLPLMLMIHGGGLTGGSKSNANIVAAAEQYAARGWLVASMTYRLQSDDPVPSSQVQPLYDAIGGSSASLLNRSIVAAVDDVLMALGFLEARGDVYMPWASVWGFSAGANIALISGYSLDDFGMQPLGLAAVIEIAGSIKGAYIGTPFDAPAGADPVLMIVHGTDDQSSPFSNATDIRALAAAAALPHDFQAVDGAGHVFDLTDTYATGGETLVQRSVDYLHETVFAGQAPGPLVIR